MFENFYRIVFIAAAVVIGANFFELCYSNHIIADLLAGRPLQCTN